jgi:hypothetical protein
MWIQWMFTPVGVAVVVASLPASLVRLRKRPAEIIPLAWVFTASLQYFLFKEGADIHIFWGHYFGVCIALGMGVLTASMRDARRMLAQRLGADRRKRFMQATAIVGACLIVAALVVLARVALPQLRQARLSSGRFDEGGGFIDAEADASQFAQWSTHDMPVEAVLSRTKSFSAGRHVEYAGARPFQITPNALGTRVDADLDRIVLVDVRATPEDDLRTFAATYDVEAAGPFWRVDRAGRGGFRAMRYVEREPDLLESYFVTGTDLVRSIGPDVDAWKTWEWLDHLGLPSTAPTGAPGTVDELRIAHNLALARGEAVKAATYRARVVGEVGGVHADFTGNVRLLGVAIEQGAVPVATLLWEAQEGFTPVEATFEVKCRIVAPPPLWPSATDFYEKSMAPPMILGPSLWKGGYLYLQRFVVRHRIGREACEGAFTSSALRTVAGPPRVGLFTLP